MWEGVIEGLFELLKNIREDRVQSQDQKNQALASIIAAVNETKIYINHVNRTGQRSRKDENQLSRLWAAAAIPLRIIDRGLAERCLVKSDYWLNPENYTDKDIAKLKISLEQVYKEAKSML